MFFNKILDFFKIENLYKNSDFKTTNSLENDTEPKKAVQDKNYSSSDYKHAYEIFSYWSQHNYSRNNYKYYREPSFTEKSEYALIEILSCFSKGARGFDNFSPTLLSNLEITNIQSYLKKLADKKYLTRANLTETLTASYTVKDLKIIADSLGIKKSGKKFELIQRIEEELSSQQIEQILKDNEFYVISDKGKEKLIGNEDYIPLHRYLYLVSLAEFNDSRIPEGGRHPRNFYDNMFQILSNRKFFFEYHGNFEDTGLAALELGNLMLEEYKKTSHNVPLDVVLTNYVEYIYLCSCFCFHVNCVLEYKLYSNNYAGYILPNPIKDIKLLSHQEPYIDYGFILPNKPPSFLTHEEFKKYIHEMLSSPNFDKQKWDAKIQNRVKEFDNITQK